jgi:hypothetical protein
MKTEKIMKQLFTTCLFFIAVHFTSAQTVIQNGGLENWENLGSATEEPSKLEFQ